MCEVFPSPIGVIFFLIVYRGDFYNIVIPTISVSYRSYILSYYKAIEVLNDEQQEISVSYRSYILSYFMDSYARGKDNKGISVSYRSYILSY